MTLNTLQDTDYISIHELSRHVKGVSYEKLLYLARCGKFRCLDVSTGKKRHLRTTLKFFREDMGLE